MRYFTLATILIVSMGTGNALAKNYYVKPGGNDSASGSSHATAWRSIAKVNSFNFQKGDDVYFLSGGSWKGVLTIDWSGTDANRAIIGSYYWDGGKEVIGISGTRPTIEGNFRGKLDADVVNTASGIPKSKYRGLIQIGTDSAPQSYVIVQDMRTINSAGRGVVIWNTGSKFNTVQNTVVKHTATSGLATRGAFTTFYNNDVSQISPLTLYNRALHNDGQPCIYSNGVHNVIEDNYAHECWYEGIGSYKNTGNNIIRGNTVVAARRSGIYMANSEYNIIENNKVIGDRKQHTVGDPAVPITYVFEDTGWPGNGLASISEESGPGTSSRGNVFRNNLVANRIRCMKVSVNTKALAKGYTAEGFFYGNTCVGMRDSLGNGTRSPTNSYLEAKNNIFIYSENGNPATECNWTNLYSTLQNNYWHIKPLNADCQSNSDIYGGLRLQRSSGWGGVGLDDIPSDTDFLPANDTVSKLGKALTKKRFNAADYPQTKLLQIGCGFDTTELSKDFKCDNREIVTNIGAFHSLRDSTAPPKSPSGLSISNLNRW